MYVLYHWNVNTKSNKEIVSIAGETHEWHKEIVNDIQRYQIGKFSDSPIGAWAVFTWDEDGPSIEKVKQ